MHGRLVLAAMLVVAVGVLDARPPSPVVAGAWGQETGEAMSGERHGARVIRGTFRNAAGERPYVLHLPDDGAAPGRGEGRALVVMLHGCTQDADDIARGTRLHEAAMRLGWMVLYPEQPVAAHPRTCWNWYDPAHQRRDAGEPSILAGMTAEVVAAHGGDPRRVYLAGMSAGAATATLVAAAYPERFAALALHSGLVHSAASSVGEALGVMQKGVASPEPSAQRAHAAMGSRARVIPTLVIHGEADLVVAPINGAQAARQWFLTNALAMGQPLDTTSGATDHGTREEGGYEVRRSTYRAKDGTPLSELVMVRGLGHAWSGGSSAGTFADPQGPDAAALVVEFFLRTGGR